MRPHPLAKRYAKALFELANERGSLEAILEEVRSFSDIIESNKRLRAYLYSPEIEKKQKLQIVESLFKDKVSGLFYNFLLLLIRKGRQGYYPEIVFEFDTLYDKKNNRIRATIISAVQMDEEQFEEIQRVLKKSLDAEIFLTTEVDKEILGGLIIKVDGKVMNNSLAHQLNILKRDLKTSDGLAA